MKKLLMFTLCAAMLLSIAACSAPGNTAPEDTAPPTEDTVEDTPTPTPPVKESAAPSKGEKTPRPSAPPKREPNTEITELYALDGEYADSFDNRYLYSYHVPQFADDSEDAAEMNREIAQVFGTMVEDELLTMEQDCSLITLSIEWDAYYYRDHIVFLVITAENDWGGSEHMVCAYDAAARDDLDFEDIAALAGYSEDALLAAIRAAAEASFAASFGPNKDMFGEQYYNEMRDWTLSEENINDDTMVYLDDDGHIYAIVAIAAPAGAGWYYNTMKIA